MIPRLVGLAWIGVALVAPRVARADLPDDVERLVRAWSDRGARVERLPPIFLEQKRARTLVLAPSRNDEMGCTTVAVIGVRTADFYVTRDETREGERPRDDARVRSAGGTVTVSACGEARGKLERVRVEMGSPRATIEIVTVRSDDKLRALREILPERAPGPLAPRGDPGGPIEPRPLAERVMRAALRAKIDHAADVDRVTSKALANGAGRFDLDLAPGCHRLEIMAEGAQRPTDVDAEVRDASGRVLARDRSELPDARLDLCVGEITPVNVAFVGAAGVVPVVLSHARFAIPARIPTRWGPRARASFAATLLKRRAPDPPDAAITEAIGVQGTTSIPIEIQPGRCYLAALAVARGDARLLRLSAILGDRVGRDDVADRPEGVSVSFCADDESAARLDVDARGSNVFWSLVVWPMGAFSP